MKKLSLFLAILMIAMCCASFAYAVEEGTGATVARENNVTHAIKRTNPITIDGLIGAEEDWNKAEINEIFVNGGSIAARFRTMWDEDYIYILYEVKDPTMRDDNGAYENSISTTYSAVDAGSTGNNGVVISNVGQVYMKCDAISFGFDPSGNNSTGAPAFTGYVGLYGGVGRRTLVWDDVFYTKATRDDGNGGTINYYESFFKTSIVRDDEDNAIGYIMEGKVDLKQHGPNFSNSSLCPSIYAQHGASVANLTYDVGTTFSFSAAVNNSTEVTGTGSREGQYAWPTTFNVGNSMTGWGTMKLVAGDAVVDNEDYLPSEQFFKGEIDTTVKIDETQKIAHAIKGTPTIDGAIDDVWANAEVQNFTTTNIGTKTLDARFRTMWDEDYIYFLYEVTDTTPNGGKGVNFESSTAGALWKSDNIIFAIDPNYTRSTTCNWSNASGYFQVTPFGGIYDNANPMLNKDETLGEAGLFHSLREISNTQYNSDDTFFKTTWLKGGYIMEGKFAISDLKNSEFVLEEGSFLGYDTYVTDNKNGSTRDSQMVWNNGASSTNNATKGSILLVAANYEIDAANKVAADDKFLEYKPIKPVISATQKSDVVDGKYSMRFVATVKDIEYFNGAGIEITNGTKTWTVEDTTAVYRALTGKEGDTGILAVAAADGCYYTAYEITDIPEATEDTLTVKAFVIVDGVKTYTDEKTVALTPPVVEE